MKKEEYQRICADVAKKYKGEIRELKMKNQRLLHENINLRTQLYEIFGRYLNAI